MPRPKPPAVTEAEVLAARWTVAIPRFHPARLNELIGNRHKATRLKKRDRRLIAAYCLLARVPPAAGKRRVGLTVVLGPGQRGGDPDCYWKSTLDALKHAKAIADDRKECVEITPVVYARAAEPATVITLEDVDV